VKCEKEKGPIRGGLIFLAVAKRGCHQHDLNDQQRVAGLQANQLTHSPSPSFLGSGNRYMSIKNGITKAEYSKCVTTHLRLGLTKAAGKL